MEWQDALDALPVGRQGRKEVTEPMATHIVVGFMRQEIYPRLRAAQDALSRQGLQAVLLPASPKSLVISVCASRYREHRTAPSPRTHWNLSERWDST